MVGAKEIESSKSIISKKIEIIKNELLAQHEQFPSCLRTVMRAQLLLTIYLHTSISLRELISVGFTYSSIRKIVREFKKEKLVEEKFFLMNLTQTGIIQAKVLLKEPVIREWIKPQQGNELDIPRPTIEQLPR